MDWSHHTKSSESESVWNGEQDHHQKKHQHRRSKQRECEKEIEDLKKELTNFKLQLKAKHAAYMQALRKVEHYQRLNSDLFSLLKKSDSQRKNRGSGIAELESMMKEEVDDHSRNPRFRDQISKLLSELKTRERMLINKEVELLAARDSELKAHTKMEEKETAFNIEKQEKQQILQQLEELKVEKQRENLNEELEKTESNRLKQELEMNNDPNSQMNKMKDKIIEAWVQGALLTAEESNTTENITTIPLKENESLMRKVEQQENGAKAAAAASMAESGSLQSETAMLKMELEAATAKIGELRARAEQALSRAELAEKAKADLENKLKRHREKKQRRKAAMAALEEESTPSQCTPPSGATPQVYEPLSKILNLKL